jgi:hypothetical protein
VQKQTNPVAEEHPNREEEENQMKFHCCSFYVNKNETTELAVSRTLEAPMLGAGAQATGRLLLRLDDQPVPPEGGRYSPTKGISLI